MDIRRKVMTDLVEKYLGEKSYSSDTGPDGNSKKSIKAGKDKYKTNDPNGKHGIKGVLDKSKWSENPMYKKSARPPESKNKGRGTTTD